MAKRARGGGGTHACSRRGCTHALGVSDHCTLVGGTSDDASASDSASPGDEPERRFPCDEPGCEYCHVRPAPARGSLRVGAIGRRPSAKDGFAVLEHAARDTGLPPLLRAISGDLLHPILKLLGDADLPCARLACTAFRDHSSPTQKAPHGLFSARARSPDDDSEDEPPTTLLSLAASIGIVGVLEELGGHLAILQYVHEHGCPWDCNTCYGAALGGHLEMLRVEVLRYTQEHGFPLDFNRCIAAALERGRAEVVEYMRAAQPAA
ncbi:hypothetical protein T492DRAFT_874002 [Pavlovales sp. CCMP2436]|nr:hypothetical protein T492DRAFT_874002 [Pavlovales sp. CCMP2436]